LALAGWGNSSDEAACHGAEAASLKSACIPPAAGCWHNISILISTTEPARNA
jgi:hypothetical protein